jgi:hypothetical protein
MLAERVFGLLLHDFKQLGLNLTHAPWNCRVAWKGDGEMWYA